MFRRAKITALFFFSILLVSMLLLSAGLAQLEFRSGTAFTLEKAVTGSFSFGKPSPGSAPLLAARILIGLSLLALPFALLYLVFDKKSRKRLAKILLVFAITAGSLMLIATVVENLAPAPPPDYTTGQAPGLPELPEAPLARFKSTPPAWTVTAAALALAFLLAVGLSFILIPRKPPAARPPAAIQQIARNAENALGWLYAGGDPREIILRCYAEMSAALDQKRSIRRPQTMTAHEFEHSLLAQGLPADPVRRLTQLFEAARYSSGPPGAQKEQQAIDSLRAILEACRRNL